MLKFMSICYIRRCVLQTGPSVAGPARAPNSKPAPPPATVSVTLEGEDRLAFLDEVHRLVMETTELGRLRYCENDGCPRSDE